MRWIWTIAVVCGTTVIIWSVARLAYDPRYKGKQLSQYLKTCHLNGYGGNGWPRNGPLEKPLEPNLEEIDVGLAREAILNVGTNALPMLVDMLSGKGDAIDRCLKRLTTGLPWLTGVLPKGRGSEDDYIHRALVAFHMLGPRAAPAAERILPLLTNADMAPQAIVVLTLIRPQVESQILSLTNVEKIAVTGKRGAPPEHLLSLSLLSLGSFGTNASGAIPFAKGQLDSAYPRVQGAAAIALVRMGTPAEIAIPLILKTLPHSLPFFEADFVKQRRPPTPAEITTMRARMEVGESVQMKLWALEQYGSGAKAALEHLSDLERDNLGNVSQAATRAIMRIKTNAP